MALTKDQAAAFFKKLLAEANGEPVPEGEETPQTKWTETFSDGKSSIVPGRPSVHKTTISLGGSYDDSHDRIEAVVKQKPLTPAEAKAKFLKLISQGKQAPKLAEDTSPKFTQRLVKPGQ